MLRNLAVPGDPAVVDPIQLDDLGEHTGIACHGARCQGDTEAHRQSGPFCTTHGSNEDSPLLRQGNSGRPDFGNILVTIPEKIQLGLRVS
jgi:hypothetical protein